LESRIDPAEDSLDAEEDQEDGHFRGPAAALDLSKCHPTSFVQDEAQEDLPKEQEGHLKELKGELVKEHQQTLQVQVERCSVFLV